MNAKPENWHDDKGRFAEGNPGGPGNPNAKATAAWRRTLLDAATPERVRAVIDRLFQAAEAGEPWAVREAVHEAFFGLAGYRDFRLRLSPLLESPFSFR